MLEKETARHPHFWEHPFQALGRFVNFERASYSGVFREDPRRPLVGTTRINNSSASTNGVLLTLGGRTRGRQLKRGTDRLSFAGVLTGLELGAKGARPVLRGKRQRSSHSQLSAVAPCDGRGALTQTTKGEEDWKEHSAALP